MLCHYWYFLDKNFSYTPYLCDGCYNIMQKSIDFKNIAIVHIKKSSYRIYFLYMSKHEAKSLMTNSNLIDKEVFYNFFFFLIIYKMSSTTYYQTETPYLIEQKNIIKMIKKC